MTQPQAKEIIGLGQMGHITGLGFVKMVEYFVLQPGLQLPFRRPIGPLRFTALRKRAAKSTDLFGNLGVVKE